MERVFGREEGLRGDGDGDFFQVRRQAEVLERTGVGVGGGERRVEKEAGTCRPCTL